MGHNKAELDRAMAVYSDEDVRKQLSAIRSRLADYEQAFDAYVALAGAQSEKAAQMSEKAIFALDLTARIRDRERTHLEEIRKNSQTIISRKTAWVDAAAQVYNTALEAKVDRVSLMNNNELSTMAQWKAVNKKLEGDVLQLRSQLQSSETVKMADRRVQFFHADGNPGGHCHGYFLRHYRCAAVASDSRHAQGHCTG